jgi:hypothetical protein
MARKDNPAPEYLYILTAPDADSAGIGNFMHPVKVPIRELQKNLEEFTKKLGSLLPAVPRVKDYELSEISVSVNITAGGELQLIGVAKGKADIGGGLTLRFTKA